MKRLLLVAPTLVVTGCVLPSGQYLPHRAATPRQPVAEAPAALPPAPAPAPVPLPEHVIADAYADVLGRTPMWMEVRDWRERSMQEPISPDDLRHALINSREYRELAPETIIRAAYRDFGRREPDPQAMRYYRRRLLDDGWSAGRVRQAIANDRGENRPGRAPNGERGDGGRERDRPGRGDRDFGRGDPHSPDAIIERAYDDLLERRPDAAGRDHYRRLLEGGMSEADVRARIRESEEYRVTLPDTKTRRAYREVLGRDPDASGLESYRRKLVDNGWTEEDVKNDLRRSAEYRSRKK